MISFTCSCGKQLQAKEVHAGQRVQCPACAARLRIPDPDDDGPRSRRRSREREPEEETPAGRTGLIIGAIVAGVLALGAVVTVVLLLLLGSNKSIDAGGKISPGNEGQIRV